MNLTGPKAPKDPTKKGKGFYIKKNQNIAATKRPDGCRSQEIYMDNDRMVSAAKITGNIEDEQILELLKTIEGFKKLVKAVGFTISAKDQQASFECKLIAYGKTDTYKSGTHATLPVLGNEVEHVLLLDEVDWSSDDKVIGQFAIVFPDNLQVAQISIKLYLNEGFDAPEEVEDNLVDTTSEAYQAMIAKSFIQLGNTERFERAVKKVQKGEDVTVAYIGGSITQGAGAVPIATECYAFKSYEGFCKYCGQKSGEQIHYIKAGIGGTSSELGVVRYEKDVLEFGKNEPDVVIIEFAVNDTDDETNGECYEGLLRKVYNAKNDPAVILLFSVFSNDWNLQERFIPMGELYDLPMVSVMNAVTPQFALDEAAGRIVSKRQFFYDIFHPTNLGHIIMSDCLCYYFKQAIQAINSNISKKDPVDYTSRFVMSKDFEEVHYFDRKQVKGFQIDAGSFTDQDKELQMVERDLNNDPIETFPDNWMHKIYEIGNQDETVIQKPFVLDIECRILILLTKDTAEKSFGKAKIVVDGKVARIYDPNEVGWTHCNAALILREQESSLHHVEISMLEDDSKRFTILGFGYVK